MRARVITRCFYLLIRKHAGIITLIFGREMKNMGYLLSPIKIASWSGRGI
jgi:hypothetical protein